MPNGHVIVNADRGQFCCKRCGTYGSSEGDKAFKDGCLLDIRKNQPHSSHKMKYTANKNHPWANEIRTCTKCERMSLRVDDFFSEPCAG